MAGRTIYVIDNQNVEHRIDNVTAILLDRLPFIFFDGTWQSDGELYSVATGIPEPGTATVGTVSGTPSIYYGDRAIPTTGTAGMLLLPDRVAGVRREDSKQLSVFEFVVDGWADPNTIRQDDAIQMYPFWFKEFVKGISTNSLKSSGYAPST